MKRSERSRILREARQKVFIEQHKIDTSEKISLAKKIVIFEYPEGARYEIKIYGKGLAGFHENSKGIITYKTLSSALKAVKKIRPDFQPECQKLLPDNAHRNARLRKAWLNRRDEIITDGSVCHSCGCLYSVSPLQIHHTSKEAYSYENFHLYETLSPELPFVLICKKCHFADHNGLVICSVCKKNYKQKAYPTCWKCSGKEETPLSRIMHDINKRSES